MTGRVEGRPSSARKREKLISGEITFVLNFLSFVVFQVAWGCPKKPLSRIRAFHLCVTA